MIFILLEARADNSALARKMRPRYNEQSSNIC
jgi:hypothetical protein